MKACIIGAGFIAANHASSYTSLPGITLCGICDIRAEAAMAMANQYHCRAFCDAMEMLSQCKPDLVSVCVPTHLHREAACIAMAGGADVLCEKPLALDLSDCLAMQEFANNSGRRIMAAQVLRFWPEYALMHEMIGDGAIGTLRRLQAQRIAHSTRGDWFGDPLKGGGALFDLLVHDLDYAVSLLGSRVISLFAQGYQNKQGSWIHVNVLLKWEGGVQVSLEAAGDMPPGFPFTMSFRADGDEGTLDLCSQSKQNIAKSPDAHTRLIYFKDGETRALNAGSFPQGSNVEAFLRQIRAFAHGSETGHLPIPFEQSICVMYLIHQIRQSLQSGLQVVLDPLV